jgi:hypothetical protein
MNETEAEERGVSSEEVLDAGCWMLYVGGSGGGFQDEKLRALSSGKTKREG